MDFVRKGFEDLYTTGHLMANWHLLPKSPWQASLFDTERDCLYDSVSTKEVKKALWSIKTFKALGPNGLHAGFFQRFWLTVGDLVTKEIKTIFHEKRILEYLNETNITLGNYRPIELCNTVYKMVTKIIVVRLRSLLNKLVSPVQTTFVPGRKGVDNAIIV